MINNNENEFIKFDTIKIKTKIEYLLDTYIPFNTRYNKGVCTGEYYNSKSDNNVPYNLYIAVSYTKQTLTLEFSSKALLDDYPKLITRDTFRKCLENINALGICSLDVDAICEYYHVTKCDITRDVDYLLNDDVFNTLNLCVNNYRRFRWKHYENEGIRYTSDVKSRDCMESIVVYDKEKEIVKNKEFLSLVKEPDSIINYFKDKVRFEMELNTAKQICKFLGVENTHVSNIWNSKANPLLNQFNKVFGNTDKLVKYDSLLNFEEYAMMAIIEKYDANLQAIRQDLKDNKIYSPNSRGGLDKRMNKFQALSERLSNEKNNSHHILRELSEKLS